MDPAGRKIVYVGTKAQREKLKTITRAVAKSDPKLANRFNSLLKSKNTHKILYRNKQTSTTGFENSNGVRNGEGSSTDVYISDIIESGDTYSDGSQRTEATVVAHEFF